VLLLALALVFGIGRVLGGAGDGKDSNGNRPDPQAAVVAGQPTGQPTYETASPATPTSTLTKQGPGKKSAVKPKKPPLAQPQGPCADTDVIVTPQVQGARAGGNNAITLLFTTRTSEACTFAVSSESVVLKLTSGSDRIWSSQQCPKAIPTTSVIARRAVADRAVVTWNGQRSNEECSRTAPWALPGYYHAEAAVLGGDPTDVQFQLGAPKRATITPKPKIVKPKKKG
jgi:hypothetical protein